MIRERTRLRWALRYVGIRTAAQLQDEGACWREYEAGKSVVRSMARTETEYRRMIRELAEWVGV